MNVLLMKMYNLLKFIYSEKATKFFEISTLLLSYVVPVKSKVEISQDFVAFSEYMYFKIKDTPYEDSNIAWCLGRQMVASLA